MRLLPTQPSVAATLLASLLFACPTAQASAEEEFPSRIESSEPRECTGRFVAGPAVGIPLGVGTAALGAVLIYAGTDPVFDSRSNNAAGVIAGGSIMVAVGLAAFLYSSVKLRRNLETRDRVCSEIRAHRPPGSTSEGRARRVSFDGLGIRF